MATRERGPTPDRGVNDASGTRYDLLLALIPAAFAVSVVAGLALSLPVHFAVAVASVVATVPILDAMFLNPPVSGRENH